MDRLKLNLVELDPDCATIQGQELAIEDKETGCIYLSSKPYVDKLFKLMGFKNLNVIKILEEYAGKVVSDVGNLDTYGIFIDKATDSFIVTQRSTINWVKDFYRKLEEKGFTVVENRKYDTYYIWDQLLVKSPSGTHYAIYMDLCGEKTYVLALDYDGKNLKGIIDEGTYKFEESDLDSLMTLMENPVDISVEFTPDQKLSIYEYVNLLSTLGYVSKKKKVYFATDEAAEIQDHVGNLDAILDDFNSSSWIQQRIREVPNGARFKDACEIISLNLDNITFWSLKNFFMDNARERSDFFALNY